MTDVVGGMTIFRFGERDIEDDVDESAFEKAGEEKENRWRGVKEVKDGNGDDEFGWQDEEQVGRRRCLE